MALDGFENEIIRSIVISTQIKSDLFSNHRRSYGLLSVAEDPFLPAISFAAPS